MAVFAKRTPSCRIALASSSMIWTTLVRAPSYRAQSMPEVPHRHALDSSTAHRLWCLLRRTCMAILPGHRPIRPSSTLALLHLARFVLRTGPTSSDPLFSLSHGGRQIDWSLWRRASCSCSFSWLNGLQGLHECLSHPSRHMSTHCGTGHDAPEDGEWRVGQDQCDPRIWPFSKIDSVVFMSGLRSIVSQASWRRISSLF